MRALLAAALLAGCASFEDPTVVLDMRVIGMTAEPPEQVVEIPLDADGEVDPAAIALAPTRVCAHVADPGRARSLVWSMTACLLDDDLRCDPASPQIPLGFGVLPDPEATEVGYLPCSVIDYTEHAAAWVALLRDALESDPTRGLGGVDYAVELRVGGSDEPRPADRYATKQMRISARFPADRAPNHNPVIENLQVSTENSSGVPVSRDRCATLSPAPGTRTQVQSGQSLTLYPIEPPDRSAREEFYLPTLDGEFERFTEVLTYQWLATDGEIADAFTGGNPDVFGNETLLGTEWTAPSVDRPTDIPIWVIQRDERYGSSVLELCIRVIPRVPVP